MPETRPVKRVPAQKLDASFIPPVTMDKPQELMNYMPPSSAMLGPWMDALTDTQARRVWKAVAIEQWGDCSKSDALRILQSVDDRFVSVKKVKHGHARKSPKSNASSHFAA